MDESFIKFVWACHAIVIAVGLLTMWRGVVAIRRVIKFRQWLDRQEGPAGPF